MVIRLETTRVLDQTTIPVLLASQQAEVSAVTSLVTLTLSPQHINTCTTTTATTINNYDNRRALTLQALTRPVLTLVPSDQFLADTDGLDKANLPLHDQMENPHDIAHMTETDLAIQNVDNDIDVIATVEPHAGNTAYDFETNNQAYETTLSNNTNIELDDELLYSHRHVSWLSCHQIAHFDLLAGHQLCLNYRHSRSTHFV